MVDVVVDGASVNPEEKAGFLNGVDHVGSNINKKKQIGLSNKILISWWFVFVAIVVA